jgi:energy-coupling factor transporter ATP-binding protein EcfA2
VSRPGTGETYSPAPPPPAGAHDTAPDVPAVVPFPGTELPPPVPEYPLTHRKDGLFELFTIGDFDYRLGGVKPLFVTSLRVNIRVGNGERNYYDGLDLYLARSRTAFSTAVQRALGAEPARVERDLVRMLEYLEKERDASLILKGKETATVMTAAEKEAGMELLTDPNLFDRVVEDLSALGYVGEDLNKQLLYLCASSRKLDDPMSVLILSQSASGKSFLVDCVKRLMPPEDVIAVTSLSDQALNYISDLTHKFLILGEAVHSEAVEHQIREMLSGKELSRLVVEKDPDTGRMESRLKKMPVIVSSVMGSTSGRINPENASRCFLVNADESREQTERIHEAQRQHHGLEFLLNGRSLAARTIAQHQAAQRLLQKRHIVNDFARHLVFPAHLMRTRRDHERFLNLIDCVCFVRQYQKKTESEGAAQFIRCDLEDYRVAYRLMVSGVLSSTMEELSRGSRLLYEQIRTWVHTEARRKKLAVTDLRFTQRHIREATGLGHTWIKANMHKLVDYEYLEAQGKERSKTYYRLPADDGIVDADLSMIPSPQAMAERLAAPPS